VSEVIYYFNAWAEGVEEWSTNPGEMVDGVETDYASTTDDGDIQLLTGNTCPGTDLGTITKVELQAYAYSDVDDQLGLRPVFGGITDGQTYWEAPGVAPGAWRTWWDITNDGSAPSPWTWAAVQSLDCDVEENDVAKGNTMYCGKVQIRVTYSTESAIVKIMSSTLGLSESDLRRGWMNRLTAEVVNLADSLLRKPWLGGWGYRKKIPITGQAGAGTNYQVPLTVHSGPGSDSNGVVYLNNHCTDFPNDIR